MKIKLTEIDDITTFVLHGLQLQGFNEIELDVDYYWDFPRDELYNPDQEPMHPNLGDLYDEWNSLQNSHEKDDYYFAYDLVWVAAILRAVGHRAASIRLPATNGDRTLD